MSTLPSISAHMDAMLKTSTIETAWAMHVDQMKGYGFDRMIYGATRFRTHGNFGDVTDALILTNHDPDYLELFFGREMYFYAPMAMWAANNTGTCSWQWAQDRRDSGQMSDKEAALSDLNHEMGIVAGYSISFEEPTMRSKSAIGLCSKKGLTQKDVDDIWQEKGDELVMLNNLLNLKVSNLPNSGARKPMTKRQIEVLQWVADGKTLQDVGVIMGLSSATVEKHLRLARENLDVETTAQAVMKAATQNQFFLFEDVTEALKKQATDQVTNA